jgi:hypothetical protein
VERDFRIGAMRYVLVIMTAGLVMIALVSAGLAFENEPNDFRGVGWGMNVLQFKHLIKAEEQDKEDVLDFVYPNEDINLGTVRLNNVTYSFARDNIGDHVFYYGELSFDEDRNAVILDALKKKYGPPTGGTEFIEGYKWDGEKVLIHIFCNDYAPECHARYYSKQVMEMLRLSRERQYDNELERLGKGL